MVDRRTTPRPSAVPGTIVSPDVLLAACAARLESALDAFAQSLDGIEASTARLSRGAAAPHPAQPALPPC